MGLLTATQAYKLVDKMTTVYNAINGSAVGYATQTLTITASGGTYTISFGALTTYALAYNAVAATIQTALQALANLGANIAVSGTGPWTLTFSGPLRGPQPIMVPGVGSLTGGSATIVSGSVPSAVVGIGDGTYGASAKVLDLASTINGLYDASFADTDIQLGLSSAAKATQLIFTRSIFANWMGSFVNVLSSVSANARSVDTSIADIDTFLRWYNFKNAVTYWQCMAPPEWRDAYFGVRGAYPDPHNLYFPCTQNAVILGVTYANALAQYNKATTTLTDGATIDPTQFAGGYCYIQWTSGAGSGACTITVVGKDQDGNAETWTGSGTFGSGVYLATNTGLLLTPTNHTYSLITDVTSVACTGFTAGIFFVESRQPAGRTYPST
jgi:hypothetical protein